MDGLDDVNEEDRREEEVEFDGDVDDSVILIDPVEKISVSAELVIGEIAETVISVKEVTVDSVA